MPKTTYTMEQAAKKLGMGSGVNLFKLLREKGVLLDIPHNRPRMRYVVEGYFQILEEKYKQKTKFGIKKGTYRKTLVTEEGLNFIRELFDVERETNPQLSLQF